MLINTARSLENRAYTITRSELLAFATNTLASLSLRPQRPKREMNGDTSQNGEAKPSLQNAEHGHNALSTVPTSVTLSAEQFERLYLTPMTHRQPKLAKQVGNPTPL